MKKEKYQDSKDKKAIIGQKCQWEDEERSVREMTSGDVAGLMIIFGGMTVSVIGVIQAIKSRFHSLDAVILCVLAVLIVNIGMLISKVL